MSKFKLSSKKLSLVKVLSLGIIVLGLGCIFWSLINIWSQPKNSYDEGTDNIEYSLQKTTKKFFEEMYNKFYRIV